MKNTRDELMEEFSRILTATDGKPRPMTPEEYRVFEKGEYTSSGESEWEPDIGPEEIIVPKAEPIPAAEESKPEIESPSGWPKKIKLPGGSIEEFKSPEEWRESVRERDGKGPEKTVEKYSDKEVLKMVKEDPSHIVTNLMLQRKPEYKKFMYPMLKALVDWMTESNMSPEKGTLMYEETIYMLNELEKEADLKEMEGMKTQVDKLETIVDKEEGRRKPPTTQSGETEWKK